MKTEKVDVSEIKGVFSLILFSGPWPDAVGSVAFLDREDDRIQMEPYTPEFNLKIVRGLAADDALKHAEAFISRHSSFRSNRIAKITDDFERAVGYEMRPLYLQTTFGAEDILDISYRQRDNHIDIYVRLDPSVERKL